MAGVNRDITARGFDITGGVDDFSAGIPGRILLHPQAAARKNVTAVVLQAVRQQLHVVAGVNQRAVHKLSGRSHHQITCPADEPAVADKTTAVQDNIAAGLHAAAVVEGDVTCINAHATATRAKLALVYNVTGRTEMDVIPLQCAQHIKVALSAQGKRLTGRQLSALSKSRAKM